MDNFTTMTRIEKADLESKIEVLTKERDIARGMYCSLAEWHWKAGKGGAEASAAVQGWDLYTKEGKAYAIWRMALQGSRNYQLSSQVKC